MQTRYRNVTGFFSGLGEREGMWDVEVRKDQRICGLGDEVTGRGVTGLELVLREGEEDDGQDCREECEGVV